MENIVDFPDKRLIEEEACRWIITFEGDQPPSRQDIAELQRWVAQSQAHRDALLRYSALWNDMDLLSELLLPLGEPGRSKTSIVNRLFGCLLAPALLLRAAMRRLKHSLATTTSPVRYGLAFSLPTLMIITIAFSNLLNFTQNTGEQIYVTSIGERTTQPLKDGSIVWLNTDSEVQVDYSKEKRRIYLTRGEAYFKVAKDSARPFEVYAGSKMIRAVGTAFSVYKEKNAVRVTVAEGKVDLGYISASLTTNTGNDTSKDTVVTQQQHNLKSRSVTADTKLLGSLSAGQSIILAEKENNSLEKVVSFERQELARQLSWREGLLVFAGEPLSDVVNEISRYTSIKITLADPDLENLRIGGQFQTGETEALFDVLETGFGLKISRLSKNHVEIRKVKEGEVF